MKRSTTAVAVIVFICSFIAFTSQAQAYRYGINGYISGCTCHSNNASSATSVAVTSGSGSYIVSAGSTTSFTVSVSHSSLNSAGIDLGVKTTSTGNTNAGTLTAGTGLRVLSGEITQNDRKAFTSGTASWTFSWTAPSAPGTYYMRAAGNAVNGNGTDDAGDLWNTLSPISLTVIGLQLTSPNTAVTWCAGTSHAITWTSGGVSAVKLELSTDGGSTWSTITNSTDASTGSYTWAIPSDAAASTTCKIRVSDASNTSLNDPSDVNFTLVSPISISTHPSNQTVCAGSGVTFTVAATGSNPAYQWKKDGNNVSGATSATYSIASTTVGSAGNYTCAVTNTCGTVTSTAASLTVNVPPAISNQPVAVSKCLGSSATFAVVATGTNLTYQWRFQGTDIPGATSSSYAISNVQQTDAGSYDVVITGTCNPTVTSNPVALTILQAPAITQNPQPKTACAGDTIQFSVAATGAGLTYQWKHDGADITNGGTGQTLTLKNVVAGDGGNYTVVVSGTCTPVATSTPALLTVNALPAITTQPKGSDVCMGQSLTLSATATGTGINYQWKKNGTPIPAANSSTYKINAMSPADSGNYTVTVTGICAPSVTSSLAHVGLLEPVLIKTQPTNQSVIEGANVTFTVSATGSGLRYQWRKGATPLPNDTATSLVISGATLGSVGDYSCRVYNSCGEQISNTVHLSVNPAGSGPFLATSVSVIDFGPHRAGKSADSTLLALIKNTGSDVLNVTGMSVTGADSLHFGITSGGTVPFTLPVNATHDVSFNYLAPKTPGTHTATVSFASNSSGSNTILLKGESVLPSLTGTVTAAVTTSNSSSDSSISICNTSKIPITLTSYNLIQSESAFSLSGTVPTFPLTILPDSCLHFQLHFAPTHSGSFTAVLQLYESEGDTLRVLMNGNALSSGISTDNVLLDDLRIVPNPMKTGADIRIGSRKAQEVELRIVTIDGRTVKHLGTVRTDLVHRIHWNGNADDGSVCPAGIYSLVVNGSKNTQITQFVIVR